MSEDLQAEIERLKAENAALKKSNVSDVKLKVSQKGGVSLYGLGRFPVTLYKDQWDRLLENKDEIIQFMEENKDQLKSKNADG